MEIERKYLINELPDNINEYNCRRIEQAYLSTEPVVRVRQDNSDFYLTYKSSGMLAREEYNLPLTKESYEHLIKKSDGIVITKDRYEIPIENGLIIELDIFHGKYEGLFLAEVEFNSMEEADAFTAPDWFGEDVTFNPMYHNSNMSKSVCHKTANLHE